VSAVQSASSATSYSGGAQGGTSFSFAANRQTATVQPGAEYGGATTILGQSVGAAGVAGKVTTSTASIAVNQSTGTGNGAASASGVSQAALQGAKSYSTQNGVSGSVAANAEGVSGSSIEVGKNSAAGLTTGAAGEYSATASSTKTGLFSTNRTATTTALTTTTTTPMLKFQSGANVAITMQNEAAGNASSVAKSGTVLSTN
jgi:hypothetical protein